MKRRDFLKKGGVAALGAPAVASLLATSASSLTAQSIGKDLVVSFTGPFCFWWNNPSDRSIKVMVPPVGLKDELAPHQPWFGTSQNEKRANVWPNTDLFLDLPGYISPRVPEQDILEPFVYQQGRGAGSPPLFNLTVPLPNKFIGVRPTSAKMVCSDGIHDDYCTKYLTYATGVTLLYNNVDLNAVRIKLDGKDFFTPCFENDRLLPTAGLGIHMTPLQRQDIEDHQHAKYVWKQMLKMYPWMNNEIERIEFCPTFDPSSCKDSCQPKTDETPKHTGTLFFGTGNNCEAPNMCLLPVQKSPLVTTKQKT